MTFWQENYQFIKEVYEMRHTKMAEWMENMEKAISRIMADKVYTSAEFKRERDSFHVRFQQGENNLFRITFQFDGNKLKICLNNFIEESYYGKYVFCYCSFYLSQYANSQQHY